MFEGVGVSRKNQNKKKKKTMMFFSNKEFTIYTPSIIHVVFHFFWVSYSCPKKNWKQCLYKILRANKVYYVRCANGESMKQQETDPYVEKREKTPI